MRLRTAGVLLHLALAGCAGPAPSGEEPLLPPGFGLFVAGGSADAGDAFAPVSEGFSLGVGAWYRPEGWPLGVEAEISGMEDSRTATTLGEPRRSDLGTIQLGLRSEVDLGAITPYVGGGVAFWTVRQERLALVPPDFLVPAMDEDHTAGVYGRMGLRVGLGGPLGLGLEYQVFGGNDATLFGEDLPIDAERLLCVISGRF